MKRLLITICLLAASGVLAQTADVIELSPDDAARAQKAWETLQKAQVDWDHLQGELHDTYVLVKQGDPDAGNTSESVSVGWATGTTTNSCMIIGSAPCPPPTPAEKRKQKEWDDAHLRYIRKGFECGIEFSKDFNFIVPKHCEPPSNYNPFTIRPAHMQEAP